MIPTTNGQQYWYQWYVLCRILELNHEMVAELKYYPFDLLGKHLLELGKKFAVSSTMIPKSGIELDYHAFTLYYAEDKWWRSDSCERGATEIDEEWRLRLESLEVYMVTEDVATLKKSTRRIGHLNVLQMEKKLGI